MSTAIPLGPQQVGAYIEIGTDWRATVLDVIEAGWKLALGQREVRTEHDEPRLNECLRKTMRQALARSSTSRRMKLTLLPETLVRRGLPDIPVFLSDVGEKFGEHEPHAYIECKRVAADRPDLCRLYVVQGIDRFRDGKYGGRHLVGFMAAYILGGSAAGAADRINAYLGRQGRSAERLGACTVVDEPWVRSSLHPRSSVSMPIELHHTLLVFRTPEAG